MKQLLAEMIPMKVGSHPFCSAIIVAAGKGRRMEASVNKVYIDISGKKTIIRTLEPFQQNPFVDEIILVVSERDISYCGFELIDKSVFSKVKKITAGGCKRQDSVYNGLQEISEKAEIIVIHDGARPLVTEDIIERSVRSAMEFGAVSTAVPVKDTVKTADQSGFVSGTLDRSTLWAVQTPQAFKRDIIREAHEKARELDVEATDDAMLVENLGYKLKLVEGSYENIKLTTPEDVIIARAIIQDRDLA